MKINNLIIVALIFVFFIGYFRYLERRSIYFPMRQIEYTPKEVGLSYEDIFFKTEDGVELNGWFIPAERARSTILFLHGNAGNISHRFEKIQIFHDLDLNVFIFDYRGYGKSRGSPSENGLYLDAKAAYDHLVSKEGIRKDEIILFGESLGGSVAVDLASKREVKAIIVESTFSSAKDIARRIYPFIPQFFITSDFDSVKKIKDVRIPKLIIHSVDDEIVPFDLGQKLFEIAPSPKTFLKLRGGHNTAFLDSEAEFKQGIRSFVSSLTKGKSMLYFLYKH